MTKTKKIFIPVIIVFALIAVLAVCFTPKASAELSGEMITLNIRGHEIEGEYIDVVDDSGNRHIELRSDVPVEIARYAVIINVDAPFGDNITIIDDDETLETIGKFDVDEDWECTFEVADNEVYYYDLTDIVPSKVDPEQMMIQSKSGTRHGKLLKDKNCEDRLIWGYDGNGMTHLKFIADFYVGNQ